ncbi:MAG TPA: MFS transporter [Jatrophihabitans sp.]|nr:MFS transporter [Jatrophihabitans sp.]
MNGKRVTFADVLRVREFRILWLADAQSSVGDQLARVALAVLVFERTSSAVLTAATYALTFLPALIGGTVLSTIADRVPRRRVMVACDVIRGVLFAGMALPHLPLLLLCFMLVLAVLCEAPFTSAQAASMPLILPEHDLFVVGTGLRTITFQTAQLAGFAGGGLAVALIGPRGGLAVDAVTFGLSAILIMMGVRVRPAAQAHSEDGEPRRSSMTTGIRLVFTSPKLRVLVLMVWLAGVYIVPEGIAAPYASKISHGAAPVGWLLAAQPVGTALGTYLFVRWVPARLRSYWMAPLGAAAGLPFIACVTVPPLPVSLALWMLSGLLFCYQVQVFTEFARTVPDRHRGQAIGIGSSGLLASQGIGILLGGWAASALGVGWAVAGSGLVGIAVAAILGVMWLRAQTADEDTSGAVPDARPAGHRAASAEGVAPMTSETVPEPVRRGARRRLVDVGNQQQHRHRA